MTRSILLIMILLLAGCAEPYTVFHNQTGKPIILGRRAYTYEGCLSTMREEAARLGVTFRTIQVKGSWEGRSLLWPFEPGYACEGLLERLPQGIYLNVPPLTSRIVIATSYSFSFPGCLESGRGFSSSFPQ
jgi:hypothetical protein